MPSGTNNRVVRTLAISVVAGYGRRTEGGVRRHWERSTCPSERVAVDITRPSEAMWAGNSRVTDAKLETFEHAGGIVRVPAVPEYQRRR